MFDLGRKIVKFNLDRFKVFAHSREDFLKKIRKGSGQQALFRRFCGLRGLNGLGCLDDLDIVIDGIMLVDNFICLE